MINEKKPGKRQLQSQANKTLIYETAKKMFQEYGYEKTTMGDICRETGLSVGTIYHYYRSKEDILLQICEQAAVVTGNLDEDIKEKAKDPFQYILEFMNEYARFWESVGADLVTNVYRIFDRAFLNDDYTLKNIKSHQELGRFIAVAQELGTFDKSMAAQEAANYLFTAGRGLLYEWFLRKGSYSLTEHSEIFMPRIIRTFIVNDKD